MNDESSRYAVPCPFQSPHSQKIWRSTPSEITKQNQMLALTEIGELAAWLPLRAAFVSTRGLKTNRTINQTLN